MTTLADKFLAFDDALARKAHQPPLSEWWRTEARKFLDAYESGAVLEHWACAGRGGAKSTYAYKLAMFLCLSGEFQIPPNEMHFALVLSRNKTEAGKGIVIIARWLAALGIEHEPRGEVIELPSFRRGIRVVSASVSATSGWRCFAVFADEFSKWSRESEAQLFDADETLASARATTVTHSRAPLIVTSTPWTAEGSFFETISAGEIDGRVVSGPAASWITNPDAITEAHTHRLERREHVWRREYKCEFVDSIIGGFFPPDAIAKCTDHGRHPIKMTASRYRYTLAIDPAFHVDRFSMVVCHAESIGGRTMVHADYVGVLGGQNIEPTEAVSKVAALRINLPGGRAVYSDQHHAASLGALFMQRNVVLMAEAWTAATKWERYEHLRTLIVDGRIRLPDCGGLRAELGRIGVYLSPNGNELIRSSGADDRVSALVHAAWHAAQLAPLFGADGRQNAATRSLGAWRYDWDAPPPPTVADAIAASIRKDGRA